MQSLQTNWYLIIQKLKPAASYIKLLSLPEVLIRNFIHTSSFQKAHLRSYTNVRFLLVRSQFASSAAPSKKICPQDIGQIGSGSSSLNCQGDQVKPIM